MKRIIFISLFGFIFTTLLNGQIRYGLRAGLNTTQLNKETIAAQGVSLAIKEAKYGFHFGIFGRFKPVDFLYIQPELMFNSNSVDFSVTDPGSGIFNKVLNEKYQYLDIPLMLGLKFGVMRLEGGPVGHAYIASKSELEEIDGYEKRFNNFTVGYQAGIGVDLWKITLDLRYEGNFTKFGDHIVIGGENINFSNAPNRLLLTAGFSF